MPNPLTYNAVGQIIIGEFDWQVTNEEGVEQSSYGTNISLSILQGQDVTFGINLVNITDIPGFVDLGFIDTGFTYANPFNETFDVVVPPSGVTLTGNNTVSLDGQETESINLTIASSLSASPGIFHTAIKTWNPNDLSQSHIFIITIDVLPHVTATVDNWYRYMTVSDTEYFEITYTNDATQGSNTGFDLTLTSWSTPTNTTAVYKDSSGSNIITTIPYYGITVFRAYYTTASNTGVAQYPATTTRLQNTTESVTIYSDEYRIEVINGNNPDFDAFFGESSQTPYDLIVDVIAGNEISVDIPITQYWTHTETYTINFTNMSGKEFTLSTSPTYTFDESTNSITQSATFFIPTSCPTLENEEVTFQILNESGAVVSSDGTYANNSGSFKFNITGAVINFSVPEQNYSLPQGSSMTFDSTVSLEDNGVAFTDSLSLLSSNVASGIEFYSPEIIPTIGGATLPITITVDGLSDLMKSGSISLTLHNGSISGTLQIYLTVVFSTVSDFDSNPIIENNGVLRILPGNNGTIQGAKSEGTWIGHIDRTYMNESHTPPKSFYLYPTTLKKFTGEFSVDVTTNGVAGHFTDETHYYKIAQIYDGNQRSMLGNELEADYEGSTVVDSEVYKYGIFTIKIPESEYNNRVTELEIYRSSKSNGEYSRILNIPTVDDTTLETTGEGVAIGTTYTGTVKDKKTMFTDLADTFSVTSGDPNTGSSISDGFYTNSHWRVFQEDHQLARYYDTNNAEWDHMQTIHVSANGVLSITYSWNSDDNYYFTNGQTTPTVTDDPLFKTDVTIQNWFRYKPSLSSSWTTGKTTYSVSDIECRMWRGRNLIFCTADTGIEDSLVGKFIKYGNQIRQITANDGKFIQVDEDWDGTDDIVGQSFKILNKASNIEFSKVTENSVDKFQIKFNDMNFSSLGSDPNATVFSNSINGKFAKLLNGRLFQGNVVLDPGNKDEARPYWVSYSELDQPDNNPVSNIITFLDKEGGSITGLTSLFDRLVVMKEQGLFIVTCPSNVRPENWSSNESIHNIGNIAENGFLEQGDQLYVVFHDGIYKLNANNIASSDTTPTERLKITDPIQDIYDSIVDKKDIISIYDQYRDEILFRWHRGSKNLIRNGDFASGGSYWDLNPNVGGTISSSEQNSGTFSAKITADGTASSPGVSLYSEYIPIDITKTYTASVYAKCPTLDNEKFFTGFLFYDSNKSKIGGYPSIKVFGSPNDTWTRYSQVIGNTAPAEVSGDINGATTTVVPMPIPVGAEFIRLRAYWWASAESSDFPEGDGYVDQWQFEENSAVTDWEEYEKGQEIWAYNVNTSQWRQVHTSGSVGKFALDHDSSVIYWDDRDHKIKSFNEKESISASIVTHPISITDDRYEVVRQLSTKVKSPDAITVNIIGDGDANGKVTTSLDTQTRPTLQKQRLRKKCKDVQLEIISPASTNDVEVHNIELEYT